MPNYHFHPPTLPNICDRGGTLDHPPKGAVAQGMPARGPKTVVQAFWRPSGEVLHKVHVSFPLGENGTKAQKWGSETVPRGCIEGVEYPDKYYHALYMGNPTPGGGGGGDAPGGPFGGGVSNQRAGGAALGAQNGPPGPAEAKHNIDISVFFCARQKRAFSTIPPYT